MTLEERFNVDGRRAAQLNPMDTTSVDESVRMKAEGQALLDAADDAINRALSRDSSLFLAQGRQTGGQ